MKKCIGIIILAIGLIGVGLEVLDWRYRHALSQVSIYAISVEARCAETGELLRVGISGDDTNAYLPDLVEISEGKPYRIICADVKPPHYSLTCEGYEDFPLKLERVSGSNVTSDAITVVAKMKKKAGQVNSPGKKGDLQTGRGGDPSSPTHHRDLAWRGLQESEAKLAEIVAKIKLWYSDDKFLGALDASQLAWRKHRDAQMTLIFPETENPMSQYGTSYRLVFPLQKTALTNKRIEELTVWTEGVVEGDLGFPSVHWKRELEKIKAEPAKGTK
jgi:uncharacterized protein YecT (DUF1311 family)